MQSIIKRSSLILLSALALVVNLRCKEPYILPATATQAVSNILHVEGLTDLGNGSAMVVLSRTVQLTDTVTLKPELNAQVTFVSNDGDTYYLNEQGNGAYVFSTNGYLSNPNKTYRLIIVTSSGVTYQSDFVPVKISPPIDSLHYQLMSNGIQIYSATHDPNNTSRYYRWDYTETWIIHSEYQSYFETRTNPRDTLVFRPNQDQIYTCWVNAPSNDIILNSSAKLSQDVIAANPVAFISSASPKVSYEYSILVNQYVLTQDAFNYWQDLRKNTEQLGGIFDAQPSQIQGNMHCVTHPSETVLGYLSAGASSQKRIFIGSSIIPQAWVRTVPDPNSQCQLDTLYYDNPTTHLNQVQNLYIYGGLPISILYDNHHVAFGVTSSSQFCIDCTLRGSNVRPPFWEDHY